MLETHEKICRWRKMLRGDEENGGLCNSRQMFQWEEMKLYK